MSPRARIRYYWILAAWAVLGGHCSATAEESWRTLVALDAVAPGVGAGSEPVELVQWDAQQNLTFRDRQGQTAQLAVDAVVRFGRGVAPRMGQGVLLVDGSVVIGRVVRVTAETCHVSTQFGPAIFPRPLVRAALFAALPVEGFEESFLRQAIEMQGTDDTVVLVDGDVAAGTLVTSDDGTLFEAGVTDAIRIVQGELTRGAPLGRVRGVIFSPLLAPLLSGRPSGILLGIEDGSRLRVEDFRFQEGVGGRKRGWRARLVCGAELHLGANRFALEDVTYIASGQLPEPSGMALRLNRQAPLRVRTVPLVGPPVVTSPGASSPDGEVASSAAASASLPQWRDQQWYQEAIRMPVGTQAVYAGTAQEGRFRSAVAVAIQPGADPGFVRPAVVRFRLRAVLGDGSVREVWQSAARAEEGSLHLVDVSLPPSAALILEAERIGGSAGGIEALWIDPLWTGKAGG